ncbi:hypothetical protein ColLi_06558 [Colletotrichum liriopes]|uniref:Uncharacterized protein n=1 Tax=Colletotrichum liriopes TaxID=708192 RepID=A0AA37GML5_9PEZI|nr:hypothetical protein ColLi_06558 [Colletotrichum liriopes]
MEPDTPKMKRTSAIDRLRRTIPDMEQSHKGFAQSTIDHMSLCTTRASFVGKADDTNDDDANGNDYDKHPRGER